MDELNIKIGQNKLINYFYMKQLKLRFICCIYLWS